MKKKKQKTKQNSINTTKMSAATRIREQTSDGGKEIKNSKIVDSLQLYASPPPNEHFTHAVLRTAQLFLYFFVLENSFIIIASHSLLLFRLEKCVFRESNQSQILEYFFGKREKCGFDNHHKHAQAHIQQRKHHVRCTHFVSVFFYFRLFDVVTFDSCGLSGKRFALEMFL